MGASNRTANRVMATLNSSILQTSKDLVFGIMDLTNRNKPLIPPLKLRRVIGQSDNYTQNRTDHFEDLCELTSHSNILDVGCGCGSLAYSLIKYRNFQGNYEGFDVIKEFTDWLAENVTSKYPNYHFKHANVYNKSYNPSGKIEPTEFRFPYKSNTFDMALLGSVFTHMLPSDLENYLSEVNRVLKPQGKCLISYFLLSSERPQSIVDHEFRKRFVDSGRGYWTINIERPEDAVAYQQGFILSLYKTYGLQLAAPVIYSGYQDAIVASKLAET